ncbi:unnamed protein product [Rotaria sp. Silwood2]|nr:unnamed protein product [Rotaria sp. Silwood2]CAF4346822.1 unnamed protein product [Rotaria sp. Silwood2]
MCAVINSARSTLNITTPTVVTFTANVQDPNPLADTFDEETSLSGNSLQAMTDNVVIDSSGQSAGLARSSSEPIAITESSF